MVERNISLPFSFYCLSDTKMDGIETIPLDLSLDLESYWWKICLFNIQLDGPILYFDLDIVIQSNIDSIVHCISTDKILSTNIEHCGIDYPFDGSDDNVLTIPEGKLNSSVLGFYSNHKDVYDKFMDDSNSNIILYYGLDRFLTKEFYSRFEWLSFKDHYYFRNKGMESYDPKYVGDDGLIFDPTKPLCIVSQGEPEVYDKLEKYFL